VVISNTSRDQAIKFAERISQLSGLGIGVIYDDREAQAYLILLTCQSGEIKNTISKVYAKYLAPNGGPTIKFYTDNSYNLVPFYDRYNYAGADGCTIADQKKFRDHGVNLDQLERTTDEWFIYATAHAMREYEIGKANVESYMSSMPYPEAHPQVLPQDIKIFMKLAGFSEDQIKSIAGNVKDVSEIDNDHPKYPGNDSYGFEFTSNGKNYTLMIDRNITKIEIAGKETRHVTGVKIRLEEGADSDAKEVKPTN